MQWFKTRRSSTGRNRHASSRKDNRRTMRLESLEDRKLLATVLVEESTFDPGTFIENATALLDFNTVGYGLAVAHDGQELAASGGLDGPASGWARTGADTSPTLFTPDTRLEVASVSKVITTVGVLHVLEDQFPDLDAALSTPISQFLPSDWTMGSNVGQVTVRHLLTHTSGFQEVGNPIGVDFNSFGQSTMQNLRALVAAGLPATNSTLPNGEAAWTRSYNNANFSLLAKMLPYMQGDNNELLDAVSEAANQPVPLINADAVFGSMYKAYVQENVLAPSGIVGADMDVTDVNPALGYNFPEALLTPGLSQADQTNTGGAFGWKLSAPELVKFLESLQSGALISTSAVNLMNANDFALGWSVGGDLTATNDPFGDYYSHGGSASSTAGAFKSIVVVLPGDVQSAMVMNNDSDGDGVTMSGFEVIRQSYLDAWTDLVVAGDPSDNIFELRLNADPNFLDLIVDDAVIFSNPISVLQSIELRGMDGNDTFLIEDLPEHIDLVLLGGEGNDNFELGNPAGNSVFTEIRGNIVAFGGAGDDAIDILDANGLSVDYTLTGLQNNELQVDSTLAASDYPADKLFQIGGIEDVELHTSLHDNLIVIDGVKGNTRLEVHAGLGDDEIQLTNVESQADVEIYGEGGNDSLLVVVVEKNATVTFVGDTEGLPGGDDTLTVGKGDLDTMSGRIDFDGLTGADLLELDDHLATFGRIVKFESSFIDGSNAFGKVFYEPTVEDLRLQASEFDDTILIQALDFRVDLEVFANGGSDDIRISASDADLDAIQGHVTIHGENGFAPGQDFGLSIDVDTLGVYDHKNDWSGRFELGTIFAGLHGRMQKFDAWNEVLFQVTYDQIEETTLRADNGPNKIDVFAMPPQNVLTVHGEGGNDLIQIETTPALTAAMRVFGDSGSDTIRLAPAAENLGLLQSSVIADGGTGAPGDVDHLEALDTWSGNVADYTLSDSELSRAGAGPIKYAAFEMLAVGLSLANNRLEILSTAPQTTVMVLAYDGDDTLTARNLASNVHFWGGGGDDMAEYVGTDGDDQWTVQGNTIQLDGGSLTSTAEQRVIQAGAGDDLVLLAGVAGSDELFHIRPSTLNYAGQVNVTGQVPLIYAGVEEMEVQGDVADNDSLRFDGRTSPMALWGGNYKDQFDINLAAAGTALDPVLQLKNEFGVTFLTLRNYQDVAAPEIRGLYGADTFNVQVDSSGGTSRQIQLDGGLQPVASRDTLNLVFAELGSSTSWLRTSKEDGQIDINYGPLMFDIVYAEMERTNFQPV